MNGQTLEPNNHAEQPLEWLAQLDTDTRAVILELEPYAALALRCCYVITLAGDLGVPASEIRHILAWLSKQGLAVEAPVPGKGRSWWLTEKGKRLQELLG